MQTEGSKTDRAPRWRPWWAIVIALVGLVSLIYPGFIALVWGGLFLMPGTDVGTDLGLLAGVPAVFRMMGLIGVVGLVAVLVTAVLLLTFLVRGGRAPLWAGALLLGVGWVWLLRG